jgi:hypothetical protein
MAAKTEKPVHLLVAEAALAKVTKKVRDGLTLTPKASYTAVEDESGWIVRITKNLVEASKKRLTEEDFDKDGLHGGKKPMHRPHSGAGELAVAAMPAGEPRIESEKALEGGGIPELAKLIERGAKPVKKPAAKSAPKGGEAK